MDYVARAFFSILSSLLIFISVSASQLWVCRWRNINIAGSVKFEKREIIINDLIWILWLVSFVLKICSYLRYNDLFLSLLFVYVALKIR